MHQEDSNASGASSGASSAHAAALDAVVTARIKQTKRRRTPTNTTLNDGQQDSLGVGRHASNMEVLQRPLPACLVALQEHFARLHTLLAFFTRQHVLPTWRQVQATLSEQGTAPTLQQMYAIAALAPDVVVLHHCGRCVLCLVFGVWCLCWNICKGTRIQGYQCHTRVVADAVLFGKQPHQEAPDYDAGAAEPHGQPQPEDMTIELHDGSRCAHMQCIHVADCVSMDAYSLTCE